LAHMGLLVAGLYRLHDGELNAVASHLSMEMVPDPPRIIQKAGLEFPRATYLAGMACSRHGLQPARPGTSEQPIVLLPESGLFELVDNRFVTLVEGTLTFPYPMPVPGDPQMHVQVDARPVGILVGQNGEIYVATLTLGVVELARTADGYDSNLGHAKQYLFER
jgi:hypothetical protein